MYHLLDKNQVKSRLDFRQISPFEISIPKGIEPNQEEVEKHLTALKNRGCIPDPIVTSTNELIEGINQLEAAKISKQETILVRVKPTKGNNSNFTEIEVTKLTPHPLQREIYGEEDIKISKVFQSIKETGDIEPITISPDPDTPGLWRIIKGHTRAASARELGISRIRAYIVQYSSQEAENEAFLSSNTYREETNEQKALRSLYWWRIIEKRNEERQKAGVSDGKRSLTREEVGELVGWSGKTAEHAVQVVKEIKNSTDSQASELRAAFNKSVDGAYKLIKNKNKTDLQTTNWKPKHLESVEVIGGEFAGRIGEIRGTSGAYCFVSFGDLHEQHSIPIHQLKPLQFCRIPTSVKEENKSKAKSLGLKDGKQLLPDKPRNEGFNVKEVRQLPATYTGLHSLTDIAIALCQLSPSEISEVIGRALPSLSAEQINALDNAMSVAWSNAA
jgi:hypothetical protein